MSSRASEISLSMESFHETVDRISPNATNVYTILTPIEKFMFGLKSPETRRQYPKLLLKFFEFLNLGGTLEQKASQFQNVANRNPDLIENELTKFVILHNNESIERK